MINKEMKNLVKLVLFFSFSFITIFFAALLFRFLSVWIEMVSFVPMPFAPVDDIAEMAWKALPVATYLSILISLSYTARKKLSLPLSIISVVILASMYTVGFLAGINRISDMLAPPTNIVSPVQSGPGLILSGADSAMILLRESSEVRGPRVVSFPEQPLIYQELPLGPNHSVIPLPPLPLASETPWFVESIEIDFNLSGIQLRSRFEDSLINFASYAFALILLLGSLRFIFDLSQWHLANIFLGALAFRGIIALELFVNSREVNAMLSSFLQGMVPPMLLTPIVFGALATLFILYTLLTSIARRRNTDG
jgi:hypothetical protein